MSIVEVTYEVQNLQDFKIKLKTHGETYHVSFTCGNLEPKGMEMAGFTKKLEETVLLLLAVINASSAVEVLGKEAYDGAHP